MKIAEVRPSTDKSCTSWFMMVQKGESLVISPNAKWLPNRYGRYMFAGTDNSDSISFRCRVTSFPGGQLSTEECHGVLIRSPLLCQYHANTMARCIHLETEVVVIARWSKDCITI